MKNILKKKKETKFKINTEFTPGWKVTVIILCIAVGLMLIEMAKIDNYITGHPYTSISVIKDDPKIYNADKIPFPEIKNEPKISKDYNDPVYEDENAAVFRWKDDLKKNKTFGPAYRPY